LSLERLYRAGNPSRGDLPDFAAKRRINGANGHYRLANLPPGGE
jgi:hypothetical protein